MNHLEQLVAEWHEYRGYFVRRNIHVGKRIGGGYECELDVVAFHPGLKHLVHVEPSMDAHSWQMREQRYVKKFNAGRKFIPMLFDGIDVPIEIDQIALFGIGSNVNNAQIGGGRVLMMTDFLSEITTDLRSKRIEKQAVSEQYPLLRTIQFMCQHQKLLSKKS